MLEVHDLHTYYGRSHILQGVSLTVRAGEILTLLGRNGAGKTTTMRSIMALTPARRGTIQFEGREITRRPTHAIARAGIAFAGSGHRTFGDLTVRQNLLLAGRGGSGSGTSGWTLPRVTTLFPKLVELDARRASFLSGGEQQMLKLGMALLANPKLLLLDEPTEGLAPAVVAQMAGWIRTLKAEGLSILLSEQNALFALRLSDRATVVEKGRIVLTASSAELQDSGEIRQYLGI